jgi:hypothetical protein
MIIFCMTLHIVTYVPALASVKLAAPLNLLSVKNGENARFLNK